MKIAISSIGSFFTRLFKRKGPLPQDRLPMPREMNYQEWEETVRNAGYPTFLDEWEENVFD